jgi:hypothetical protein
VTLTLILLAWTFGPLLILVGIQRWHPWLIPSRRRRVPDHARIRALKSWHAQWEQDEARRAAIQRWEARTGRFYEELEPDAQLRLDAAVDFQLRGSPDPTDW